jgi:hypothetical protein
VNVTEHPVAGTHDGRALPVDEAAKCVPVTGEDGLDGRPVIEKFDCDLAAP